MICYPQKSNIYASMAAWPVARGNKIQPPEIFSQRLYFYNFINFIINNVQLI